MSISDYRNDEYVSEKVKKMIHVMMEIVGDMVDDDDVTISDLRNLQANILLSFVATHFKIDFKCGDTEKNIQDRVINKFCEELKNVDFNEEPRTCTMTM